VGYDPGRQNQGIDEASDFGAFLASDLMHGAGATNWNEMLERFPEAAQKANIQCENCHGPQVTEGDDSPAHALRGEAVGKPRLSLSSDLCGTCHGEPTRHARFQQWQVSGHGNYELAIGEGDSGDCARCHTANGFLAWVPAQTDDDPANDLASVAVTWKEDDVHPQTCVTCHDPHVVGTTTDKGTDAPMRVSDRTGMLPGGYKAVGVGKGAVCITCHNSRRGLRNDNVPFPTNSDAGRLPHHSTQADVVLGQNAYFVKAGVRGRHAVIEDTCVSCHMNKAKPPASLSNNFGGTNHTFLASASICNECHTDVNGENLAAGFDDMLLALKGAIQDRIDKVMREQIAAGNRIKAGSTTFDGFTKVEIVDGRNQQVIVTLLNGKRLSAVNLTDLAVVKKDDTTATFLSVSGYDIPKAFWNWALLSYDASKGAHNPSWTLEVINESLNRMGATYKGVNAVTAGDLVVGMR
jgi:formate-dependent nitrite reductase cytochrome c552 subunit